MHEILRSNYRGPLVLLLGVVLMAFLGAALEQGDGRINRATGSQPVISAGAAYVEEGDKVTIRSAGGGPLYIGHGVEDDLVRSAAEVHVVLEPDQVNASRLLAIPQAMQWRHPKAGLPAARILRTAESDAIGRVGPEAIQTFLFQQHGPLPVISMVMDHGALFHPDSGLMVVGNAVLHADAGLASSYYKDHRWWKYPGNYMGRGKEWERAAHLEMISAAGVRTNAVPLKVRIHGQMTRGFPQHALRLLFDDPITPWSVPSTGREYGSMVLRAAGNDQVKAQLRDAFQQTLCAGLPFEVSKAWPCVVYINGAYWGVYHLRERVDENELARRHGIPARDITVLEDAAVLYRGEEEAVKEFKRLIHLAENGPVEGAGHMDQLRATLDVDGFLTYMASQCILGNMDWPEQNVKYWKHTGAPGAGVADGRWYFIMGDSDLAFGANAPVTADMFVRVRTTSAPVARLFRGLMRNEMLATRFRSEVLALLDGPLSAGRMLKHLDAFAGLLDAEMDRHTARWRKPLNKKAWLLEVDLMRDYAARREAIVREQIMGSSIPGAR